MSNFKKYVVFTAVGAVDVLASKAKLNKDFDAFIESLQQNENVHLIGEAIHALFDKADYWAQDDLVYQVTQLQLAPNRVSTSKLVTAYMKPKTGDDLTFMFGTKKGRSGGHFRRFKPPVETESVETELVETEQVSE